MIALHDRIRRVVITGGSRGIGLATARRLLEHPDVEVISISREPSTFEHERFRHLAADLSREPAGSEAVIDALKQLGFVPDALLCAAGGLREALVTKQSDAALEEQLAVNLIAHMRLIRWAAGHMLLRRFGRVVAVSSTAARTPAPGQSVYAASKAGLEAFLKGCAVEFARKGITFNTVVPGYIRTAFSQPYLERRGSEAVSPVGRAGEPEEAAEAMLFFLGRHSDYLTGSSVVVDGGMSLAVK